jgi:hypothetical protein
MHLESRAMAITYFPDYLNLGLAQRDAIRRLTRKWIIADWLWHGVSQDSLASVILPLL